MVSLLVSDHDGSVWIQSRMILLDRFKHVWTRFTHDFRLPSAANCNRTDLFKIRMSSKYLVL